jgi:hypothetical protein
VCGATGPRFGLLNETNSTSCNFIRPRKLAHRPFRVIRRKQEAYVDLKEIFPHLSKTQAYKMIAKRSTKNERLIWWITSNGGGH